MAAVCSFDVGDIRIGENALPSFGQQANEWIIGGMNDQRRDRNAVDDIRSRCARVIIVGAGISAIVGCDAIVELAEAGNASQPVEIEMLREVAGLGPHPPRS